MIQQQQEDDQQHEERQHEQEQQLNLEILQQFQRQSLQQASQIYWEHQMQKLLVEPMQQSIRQLDQVLLPLTLQQHKPSFLEQAQFWLDQTYPNWWQKTSSKFGDEHTLCIPDSLDVGPNKFFGPTMSAAGFDKEVLKKAKSRLKGEKGEESFFVEFRKQKVSGILIHGFYTKEFLKVMSDREVLDMKVKGCIREQEVHSEYKRAAEQLNRRIPGLENIFRKITGDNDCPIRITGIVCMPFFDSIKSTNPSKKAELERKYSFRLIDKSLLLDAANFKQFWAEMMSKQEFNENYIKFLTAIIAYRPAKYFSGTCNALEIYRRIEKQDFKNTKMDHQCQVVFFNEEQQRVIESTDQRVLISGPPGTGKTLCLLQRALNASKIDKPGRVVIALSHANQLATKFQHIFSANRCEETKRPPVILSSEFCIENCCPDDDLYFDETSIHIKEVMKYAVREVRSGSTNIVITGWIEPSAVADMTKAQKMFATFIQYELKTVIRGTKTIIDEWKTHFPDRFIRIGHNITGAPIERYSVAGLSEMLDLVTSIIKILLRLQSSETTSTTNVQAIDEQHMPEQCAPSDIAVLTVGLCWRAINCFADMEIKSHLSKNKIECGSVQDQVLYPTSIAVDYANRALSYEWPIVIVVVPTNDASVGKYKMDSSYLIATSRALAKLIIIDCVLPMKTTDDNRINVDQERMDSDSLASVQMMLGMTLIKSDDDGDV